MYLRFVLIRSGKIKDTEITVFWKKLFFTIHKKMRHIKPCRATWRSTRVGQEVGGRGKHEQQRLFWFSPEEMGKAR